MAFTQIIEVQPGDVEAVEKHVSDWHRRQKGIAPGYQSARILADRNRPGTYLIEVEFDSEEDAKRNDARPESNEWASEFALSSGANPATATSPRPAQQKGARHVR